jgi:serine protease inhibitor
MTRTLRLALCSAVLGLTACDSLLGPGNRTEAPLDRLPRALTVQEQSLIRASNSFAFDILRETIADQPSANVFLSPLSASLALGMTMNGARGETQDGMRHALGFGDADMDQVNAAYRSLIDLLLGLDSRVDMRIANAIWANRGFPVHEAFYDLTRHFFDAEAASLDFGDPASAAVMNAWIEKKTAGRISDIIPDPIPPLVVMYLANAIYFKGDWQHQFDRNSTRATSFTLADGTQKSVMMMNRTGRALHHYDGTTGVQVIELPYSRGAFAMTLVLPPRDMDIDAFIGTLDESRWAGWVDGLEEMQVHVGLPRFRLEYDTKMNEPLVTLGMNLAFGRGPQPADFTGMSPLGRELVISNVFHKTFIDVNEEGTEAAAATVVEMSRTSGPPSVMLDRPFILAIRERLSGTIMFFGKIWDPDSR